MRTLYLCVVVFLLFLPAAGHAQADYQQQYLNAKNLFTSERYALAREAFRPLIARNAQNPFAPYASFYFGLSTLKAGYAEQAKEIFLQTRDRFPNWSKADEVKYWLAICYFESNDDFLALNMLKEIKDPQIKSDSEGLIYNYLMPDTDADEMEAIYNRFESPATGRVYATKLSSTPLNQEGRRTLEELVQKYNLDPDRYLSAVSTSEIKDEYKVAVLMPFLVETLKPEDKMRVNEFVIDLYEGLRLGFDSLAKTGVDINIYAYDTKRDTTVTRSIVESDEMKGMDLIIGPLFPDPMRIVNEFSHQYKITLINPLTSSPEFIRSNPYHYLYNPSVLTIGEVMADFNVEKFGEKPGIVLYGETINDRLMAEAYADRYIEKGGTLSLIRGIEKDESEQVLEILLSSQSIKDASTEEGRENMEIAADSIGHIFVASANSLIFSKVIGAVDTRGDNIKVSGAADWLESPVVKYEVFQRLGVEFYAPNYIQRDSESYAAFRKAFIRRHRETPSKYAETGFDLALFIGKSLDKYGNYPQVGWNEDGIIRGTLSPGFLYPGSQDNHLLPILTFEDESLEMTTRERQAGDEN